MPFPIEYMTMRVTPPWLDGPIGVTDAPVLDGGPTNLRSSRWPVYGASSA